MHGFSPNVSTPIDMEAAWEAVTTRDRRWDGRIIYAVQSTGVFCRPSCPSRKPYRDQVSFFLTPTDAEQAGFRACRRCRPNDPSPSRAEEAVQRAIRYIETHPDTKVTLDILAQIAGLTLAHFQRTFTRIVGMSPKQYQDALRVGLLKAELDRGVTVSSATYAAGFGSSSSVYHHAGRQLGMTPGTYRRRGRNVTIDYTISTTSLGHLLVATTDRGICAVILGDDDRTLERGLEQEYPNAIRSRIEEHERLSSVSRTKLFDAAQEVAAQIDGTRRDAAISLDVAATPFEQQVWDMLCTIPYGETRTYTEIAAALEKPEAVRAVAQACAKNPVAVIIPCHRVIRKDGSMGGYRWGLPRKVALLQQESEATTKPRR